MKRIMILVLSIAFSAGALAKGPAKAEAKAKKTDVRDVVRALTKDIEKLNYAKDDDRFKGGEKSRAAVKQLQDFEQLPKTPARLPLFKDLLALSREAAPYDEEGQIADVLSDLLKRDPALKGAYGDYLKSLPQATKGAEFCKNEQFKKGVEESRCEMEKGAGLSQDVAGAKNLDEAMKCISKFNYEECLKRK